MVTSFEERGDQEIMKEVKKVPGYPEGKMFEALVSQKMSQGEHRVRHMFCLTYNI